MAGRRDIQAGKAYVSMYVKNAGLIKGLTKASQHLRSFGAGLQSIGIKTVAMGGAMAAPFVAAVKTFANTGDALDKMSSRVGASVEFLSKLSHAANAGGTDIKAMEVGIRRMQRTAMDSTRGLSTATEVFKQLGISATDSSGRLKSTEKLFMESAEALAKIQNNTKKAALATMLFGRAGTSLLPMLKDGKAGLIGMMQEAERLGHVMSTQDAKAAAELTDAWGRLSGMWRTVNQQIGASLAPMFTKMFDAITKNSKAVVDWIKAHKPMIAVAFKVSVGIAAAGAAAVVAGTGIVALGVVVGSAATLIAAMGTAIGVAASALSAILSPVGLLATALVGLGAYFLWSSGTIKQATDWLKGVFQTLKEDATQAFGGITDALAAGEIKLAAKIFWSFLKLEWTRGISELKTKWLDFTSWWREITYSMADAFINMAAKVKTAQIELIGSLKKLTGREQEGDTRYSFYDPKTGEKWTGVDAETERRKAEVERQRKELIGHNRDAQEELEKKAKRESKAEIEAAQAELAAVQKELENLVGKAKTKRLWKDFGKDTPMPEQQGPPEIPSLQQLRGTAVGTFSAAQSRLMGHGGDTVQQKILNAAKETNKLTKKVLQANERQLKKLDRAMMISATA